MILDVSIGFIHFIPDLFLALFHLYTSWWIWENDLVRRVNGMILDDLQIVNDLTGIAYYNHGL